MDIPTIQDQNTKDLLSFKRVQIGTAGRVLDTVTVVISAPDGTNLRAVNVPAEDFLKGVRHEYPDRALGAVLAQLVEWRDQNRGQLRVNARAGLRTDFREGKESTYVDAIALVERELRREAVPAAAAAPRRLAALKERVGTARDEATASLQCAVDRNDPNERDRRNYLDGKRTALNAVLDLIDEELRRDG